MKNEGLYKDLCLLGVSYQMAEKYAKLFTSDTVDSFVFSGLDRSSYGNENIAGKALERLIPEMNGRHFKSFEIKCLDTKSVNSDFFTRKGPYFTADSLAYNFCTIQESEKPYLLMQVENSRATSLSFADISVPSLMPAIGRILNENKVTDFSVYEGCNGADMSTFFDEMKKAPLEHLSLSNIALNAGQSKKLGTSLPSSLSIVSLSSLNLEEGAENMAAAFSQMKDLKRINMMECTISDASLTNLVKKLPPSLSALAIYKMPRITDKTGRTMLEFAQRHDVFMVSALTKETGISDEVSFLIQKSVKEAQKTVILRGEAEKKAKTPEGENVSDQVKTAISYEDIKPLLIPAMESGSFNEAIRTMKNIGAKFVAEDLIQKDDQGRTIISAAEERRFTPLLMQPAFFINVKDFQTCYDALSDYGKRQMNGKNGAPSFQLLKNKMMAEVIKKTVENKTGQR